MRILHTYKSTNNGKFCDMPEKDAGGGRETGNLFGVALPTENFLRNAPTYEVDVGDYHLPVRSLEVGKEQRPAELAQVKQKEMYDKHSCINVYSPCMHGYCKGF